MPINHNGTGITSVKYNNITLSKVIYNGTVVFTSSVVQPSIAVTAISESSVSWYVTNNDESAVTIKTSLYNITDGTYVRFESTTNSVVNGANTITYTNSVTFGKQYKIMAEAIVSEVSSGMKEYAFAYWRVQWYSFDGAAILETNYVPTGYSMSARSIPARTGYTADGWSLTTNNIILNFPRGIYSNQDYIARYTAIIYTMTWNAFLETAYSNAAYATTVTSAPGMDTSRPGYTFTGWSPSLPHYVTNNQIFTAQYQIVQVTATPTLQFLSSTTNSATIRVSTTESASVSYTWWFPDWSKSGSGTISSGSYYDDFVISGLSSGSSYTVYANATVSGKQTSATSSPLGFSTQSALDILNNFQAFYAGSRGKIYMTYDSNPYYVQVDYSCDGWVTWHAVTCQLSSTAKTQYSVTGSSVTVRARNRTSSCGGSAGVYHYADVFLPSSYVCIDS